MLVLLLLALDRARTRNRPAEAGGFRGHRFNRALGHGDVLARIDRMASRAHAPFLDGATEADAAVIGRPRPDGSEDVVACIVLNDGAVLDPEGLKDYCRERLTRYKVPRTFYHFEELAKDQMGKIRRREVQADLIRRLQAEKN